MFESGIGYCSLSIVERCYVKPESLVQFLVRIFRKRKQFDFITTTHLVLGRRTAKFASAKKTFDSHSPVAVCNSPVLAIMTS
jgi:hypothetical protein